MDDAEGKDSTSSTRSRQRDRQRRREGRRRRGQHDYNLDRRLTTRHKSISPGRPPEVLWPFLNLAWDPVTPDEQANDVLWPPMILRYTHVPVYENEPFTVLYPPRIVRWEPPDSVHVPGIARRRDPGSIMAHMESQGLETQGAAEFPKQQMTRQLSPAPAHGAGHPSPKFSFLSRNISSRSW